MTLPDKTQELPLKHLIMVSCYALFFFRTKLFVVSNLIHEALERIQTCECAEGCSLCMTSFGYHNSLKLITMIVQVYAALPARRIIQFHPRLGRGSCCELSWENQLTSRRYPFQQNLTNFQILSSMRIRSWHQALKQNRVLVESIHPSVSSYSVTRIRRHINYNPHLCIRLLVLR